MLIVAALAATLAAPSQIPSMVVRVAVAPGISPTLVTALLAETDAVWRGTGITFLWEREDRIAPPRDLLNPQLPRASSVLRVVIGHNTHHEVDTRLPLGWIVFEDATTPEREIWLSYVNALELMERSPGVVGAVSSMPQLQRETLLARALGRALAHELGHYLAASKVHTQTGLMKAVHTAYELFGSTRRNFCLAAAEQQQMVARFTSIYMASRG